MSCQRINLSEFIQADDIQELTFFEKYPLDKFNQGGSQPFFFGSMNNPRTPKIFKKYFSNLQKYKKSKFSNLQEYKQYNTQLVESLYAHLLFIAKIVPIELSIKKHCINDKELEDKLRKIYIHEEDQLALNAYVNNDLYGLLFLLPLFHGYEESIANNTKYRTDFILRWNKLMLSNRGAKLLTLFRKNKFKNEYIESLKSLILSPESINSLKQFEDLGIIKNFFHEKFMKCADLFIFPIGKSPKSIDQQ